MLPEVVDAVSGRSLVAVDGGFSRGTDIIKGIALGADFVEEAECLLWTSSGWCRWCD